MSIIQQLLWPRTRALVNSWNKSSRAERSMIAFFTVFGLLFWLALSTLLYYFISTFYGIEIVGPIVLRKLMELLMLSLFGLLCFSNVVTALSNYYLSEDLELLLSLPVSRVNLHLSRLLETVAQSSWMVLALAIPILLSYGIVYDTSWLYYPTLFVVMGSLVLIPASLGVMLASILVSVFPARRIREALMVVGILVLIFIFILIRVLRPEQLANADNFDSVAAYMVELQAPVPILAPPKWASDTLMAALLGRDIPLIEIGLLVTGALAMTGLGRWVTDYLYDEGRARAQEARVARLAGSPILDRLIALWTVPLSPTAKAIVAKDVKTFVRDPAQWTQLFLVGSIVIIAIISVANLPVDSFRGPWMQSWLNGLAFLILALVGFVMAALAARFQFSAVSNEGRSFWVVRTGPISAREFLWAKAWPGFLPMLLIGETLALSSITILDAQSSLLWIGVATAAFLAFGLSGIAVGMGAMYPDFKVNNASKLAASPAGMLYMVTALSLVFLVLSLEAAPVYFLISSQIRNIPLTNVQILVTVVCLLAAVLLCIFATIYPIHKGAQRLWDKELPNG